MNSEIPARGILYTEDSPTCKSYVVPCTCTNPDDTIEFTVNIDDFQEIELQHYTLQKTPIWRDPFKQHKTYGIKNRLLFEIAYYTTGFLNSLHHRLSVTWKVWTKGQVEYYSTTILNKQQAINYADTIKRAVHDIEETNKSQQC